MEHFLISPLLGSWQEAYKFFEQGGPFMWVLLVLSIISVAVIIWRLIALRRTEVIPDPVEQAVDHFALDKAHVSQLMRVAEAHPSPFSRIVSQACSQFGWTKSENQAAIQTMARREIHHLEQGLSILEIIVGIAPLMGLLGTVSGLVGVFSTLGTDADPTKIAAGIAEALNTTIMGLAVAIPSLIAHNRLSRRIERWAVEMENDVEALLARSYHDDTESDAWTASSASQAATKDSSPETDFAPASN